MLRHDVTIDLKNFRIYKLRFPRITSHFGNIWNEVFVIFNEVGFISLGI